MGKLIVSELYTLMKCGTILYFIHEGKLQMLVDAVLELFKNS